MYHFLLYLSLFIGVCSFFLCLIAYARVGRLLKSVEGLDWSAVATLTGEMGTIKKSIQTLNNRINGLNTPVQNDRALVQQYLAQQAQAKPNGKMVGG